MAKGVHGRIDLTIPGGGISFSASSPVRPAALEVGAERDDGDINRMLKLK